MDAHEFLRSRRSVRRFKSEAVTSALIERILTTATYAPSADNGQPWRFAVLTDASTRARLADAMAAAFRNDLALDHLTGAEIEARLAKSRSRINSSPVVIILCMDMTEMDVYADAARAAAERVMAIQSTANAGLQLLLAAHAEGLGGVWTCGPLFAAQVVRNTLDLPEAWEPQAMFLIGYPDETPKAKALKPRQDLTCIF